MTINGKFILSICIWVTIFIATTSSYAQTGDLAKIAKIKSAYLLNFLKFTSWPKNVFADKHSPVVVCVIGFDTLGEALDQIVEGKKIRGRPIVVQRVEKFEIGTGAASNSDGNQVEEDFLTQIESSHLLYISRFEEARIDQVIDVIKTRNLLTVSDMPRFAEHGGMIGLVLRKNKIAFDANPGALKKAEIKVSSKILKLAKIVQTDEK